MDEWEYGQPWYHGSQSWLETLRPGSSITRDVRVARAFSHRPSLVVQEGDGADLCVRHDGTTPGYLYVVDEEVRPEDVHPHPHPVNESRWEWLTRRELRVRLVERTEPRDDELLTEAEIATLRRRQAKRGEASFVEER